MNTIAWPVCGIFSDFSVQSDYHKQTEARLVAPPLSLSTTSYQEPVMSLRHSSVTPAALLGSPSVDSSYHGPKEIAMKRLQIALFAALGLCVAAVYVQGATGPLRTQVYSVGAYDAAGYVEGARHILFGADTHSNQFPLGMGVILAVLSLCGLATAPGIMVLNLLCLAVGLAAFIAIAQQQVGLASKAAIAVALLTAASTSCFDLTTTFASELPFFAASALTLLALGRAAADWRYLPIAALGCVAAILIRTAGVALLAPLAWVIVVRDLRPKAICCAGLVAIPVAWLVFHWLSTNPYVTGIVGPRYSPHAAAWGEVVWEELLKVGAVGELFLNIRAEWFRPVYSGEFVFAGILCLSIFGAGIWATRRRISAAHVYLVAYATVMAYYPFFYHGASRRFWFPLLPLLIAFAVRGAQFLFDLSPSLATLGRRLGLAYVAAFTIFGCVLSFQAARADRSDARADQVLAVLRESR